MKIIYETEKTCKAEEKKSEKQKMRSKRKEIRLSKGYAETRNFCLENTALKISAWIPSLTTPEYPRGHFILITILRILSKKAKLFGPA